MPELANGATGERRTVAAYVSIGTEPDTRAVLHDLLYEGHRVLLPVLLDDGDLDWATYTGPEDLVVREASPRLAEPHGPRLGVAAVADASVVLVPGLAVDGQGMRLGRGGGSYDRALARTGEQTLTCVLLYDEELDLEVPIELHDVPVRAAVTPSGVRRFG